MIFHYDETWSGDQMWQRHNRSWARGGGEAAAQPIWPRSATLPLRRPPAPMYPIWRHRINKFTAPARLPLMNTDPPPSSSLSLPYWLITYRRKQSTAVSWVDSVLLPVFLSIRQQDLTSLEIQKIITPFRFPVSSKLATSK